MLGGELFTGTFRQDSCDPRWLTHGVMEFEPTETRASWLYVSSGLSNAWEADSFQADGYSGLGCEFIFQCRSQSRWAIVFLQEMVAFQLLLAAGRFPGKGLLNFWQRVPLRSPIDGEDPKLTWVLLTPTVEFSAVQQLPSGRFQFIQFVVITEQETEFARTHSSEELLKLLVANRASPVADPARYNILLA